MKPKPVTIVGGGLAGLALGISLRRSDIPVTIWEAGQYPRHKVCGEFISGKGLEVLKRLDLWPAIAGEAREAKTVSFFTSHRASGAKDLPVAALCISRYRLDHLLADRFCELGGELRQECRWTEPFGEGCVRATGRVMRPMADGWRWFGLKVHARNVDLATDLEMHFTSKGYVGLCRLPGDEVNVCGLFRSKIPVPDLRKSWSDWLRGEPNSILAKRLERAPLDDQSFCSVAGLSIAAPELQRNTGICVGDTVGMIPPVTGNGMSIAFESAELVARQLVRFSHNELDWTEAAAGTQHDFRDCFRTRLWRARLLQKLLFNVLTRETMLIVARRKNALWQYLFRSTR